MNAIRIGTSPAGVTWNVYRRPGMSDQALEAAAAKARKSLARHWATWGDRRIRVRGLTANQVYLLADRLDLHESAAGYEAGASWIVARRVDLEDALAVLSSEAPMVDNWNSPTEAQEAMAWRAAWRSLLGLRAKLASALNRTEDANRWRAEARQVVRAKAYEFVGPRGRWTV